MTTTPEIDVPSPLGFCALCIANGVRNPATTIASGDARCDRHVFEVLATSDPSGREGVLHRLHTDDRERLGGSAASTA